MKIQDLRFKKEDLSAEALAKADGRLKQVLQVMQDLNLKF
jgi:hypothetical protein